MLDLLCERLINPEIGRRLCISPKTVEHHFGRLLAKLGMCNRAEASALSGRAPLAPAATPDPEGGRFSDDIPGIRAAHWREAPARAISDQSRNSPALRTEDSMHRTAHQIIRRTFLSHSRSASGAFAVGRVVLIETGKRVLPVRA